MDITVAIDAMGGDHGPHVTVPAALAVLDRDPEVNIVLVGLHDALEAELRQRKRETGPRLRIHHASEVVTMDDPPALAMRSKKDSSMRVAIDLVKAGEAAACVSAGNTGALMATAKFVLRTLPGIDRPAILASLPSMHGHTNVLDLGANVESTPRQLYQFAVMGSVLASAVDNIARPKVGLLNIGEEEIKGNERVRETAQLLARSELNYIGFVEGDDIYTGRADVVVCDGFVGNVALKASEGVAKMIGHFVREEFSRNVFTRIAGLAAMPVMRSFRRRIDPRRYNGASLVGLRGTVVKSHGSADVKAFKRAIKEAVVEIRKNVPERISRELETALSDKEAV